MSILGSLPRGLLRLRMGIVGPTISRSVFKPHLCLTAGRRKGETLLRGGTSQKYHTINLHKCRKMTLSVYSVLFHCSPISVFVNGSRKATKKSRVKNSWTYPPHPPAFLPPPTFIQHASRLLHFFLLFFIIFFTSLCHFQHRYKANRPWNLLLPAGTNIVMKLSKSA